MNVYVMFNTSAFYFLLGTRQVIPSQSPARGTSPNIPRNGQINQYNQNSSDPPPPYPIIATNVTNLIQNRQSPTQSNTNSNAGSSTNYEAHSFGGHFDGHMNYCKLLHSKDSTKKILIT